MSPKAGLRAEYAIFRTIPTRWMDNDMYGHVNNVAYYSFFDTAVNALLMEAGLLDPLRGPVIGLVVETQCRYFNSLAFPMEVHAGIRVARLGRTSVRYEIGIFGGLDERAAAEGHLVHVYVDSESRRPAAIPERIRLFLSGLARPGAAEG